MIAARRSSEILHQVDAAVSKVAFDQFGLITRVQARDAGLSDTQIRDRLGWGQWLNVHPGVFRFASSELTVRQRLKAATLWSEPSKGVISHRSAAALFNLGRFRKYQSKVDNPVELTVTKRSRSDEGLTIYRSILPKNDRSERFGIPVTTIPRTVLDLCTVADFNDVREVLDDVVFGRRAKLEYLLRVLERSEHTPGVRILRKILAPLIEGKLPTESEFEACVRDLLDAEGFYDVIRQAPFIVRGRVIRMDFRFPDIPLVIEVDGYRYHASPAALRRDQERSNLLVESGLHILRWSWWDLAKPREILAQLHRVVLSLRRQHFSVRECELPYPMASFSRTIPW